uniref:Leucine rich repeat containing 31 n=1 Tax=Amphiprion percula TaxID=161767 RepID=A0A3P8S1I4_AMPPE
SLLQFLPQLEEVDVSWNELIGGSLAALTSHLQQVSGIRTLRICSCRLNANDVAALGGSLRYLSSVRELDLSCNKQLSGGLSRLTCHLAHVTHLESLDLHLCCLSAALSDLTDRARRLVQSGSGGRGPAAGLRPPSEADEGLPLNSCSLNEESFTALGKNTQTQSCVDVSWCKVVGGRLSLLLDSLQPSIILELRLSSCDLITDDLHHLGNTSRRGFLSSLRVLDLSYNGSVGDEGWLALFSAGGLGSLEDVDVSLRPSSSARCSAWLPSLLRALPRWAALARLALQRWTVGSEDRRLLDFILRKRSVLLEPAPPGGFPRCRCVLESSLFS